MKTLIFSAVIGSCLLTAALPAAAMPAAPPAFDAPAFDARVQLIADSSAPPDKDSYVQRVRDEMREWDRKIQDFGTKTGDAARLASPSYQLRDLAKAKAGADRAAQKLENASARGWEHAKRGFERASRKLSDTWHHINPADK